MRNEVAQSAARVFSEGISRKEERVRVLVHDGHFNLQGAISEDAAACL
jgi:hypothetical protein